MSGVECWLLCAEVGFVLEVEVCFPPGVRLGVAFDADLFLGTGLC